MGPAVSGHPGGYFVVWQDGRNSPQFGREDDIYGARVSLGGEVLDPEGLAAGVTEGSTETAPFVTTDGVSFLVTSAIP